MAIHDHLKGAKVTICVDNEPLEEYDDNEEQGPVPSDPIEKHEIERTLVKYIEAIDEKEFTIKIEIEASTSFGCEGLSFSIYVDGTHVGSPLITQSSVAQGDYKGIHQGPVTKRNGDCTVRPLRFSKIEITDESDGLKENTRDPDDLASVGTIEVVVYRIHNLKKTIQREESIPSELQTESQYKVHETALKGEAKSHGTTLGPAKSATMSTIYSSDNLDGDDYPIAIYEFLYRSIDALKALQIIHGSSGPESVHTPASPPPAALSGLSEKDRQEIEEYMERRMKVHIKRESVEHDRPPKRQKKSLGKVTIDLTEEDEDDKERSDPIVLE